MCGIGAGVDMRIRVKIACLGTDILGHWLPARFDLVSIKVKSG